MHPPSSTTAEHPHKTLITITVMLAAIIQVIDTTIANVALPHMQGSLSANQDQAAWVLTSYIVASVIATLLTSWLSDRFGRKRVFLVSVIGFTVASMLCGMAMSITQIIGFRVLQGLFGAALVPLSQATLLDINPKEKHGSAMALWGIGIMVGPIIGPALGGYLTELYNWRWVFYINLPLGILTAFGIILFMDETKLRQTHFDVAGFLSISLAIGALQLILDRGEQVDWLESAEICAYLGVMVASAWVFIVHSMTTEKPFISMALFRDRNFVTGVFFIFFVGIILLATMALLPPFLQNLMGYPVITIGLVLAPRGVGTMIGMMFVGKTLGKFDPRLMIFVGLCLTAYSLWEMTGFNASVSTMTIMSTGVVQGLGLGLIFIPLSTVAFATLPGQYRTEATSLFSLARNVGSSVGVSMVIFLLLRNTHLNHALLSEYVTPFNWPDFSMSGAMAHLPIPTAAKYALLDGLITQEAATIAYINDFKYMMLMILCITPFVLLLQKAQKEAGPGVIEVME